ncbi:DUF3047 domain-containing protein [Porticoccus sp. GXU_MW_L64]
MTCIRVFVAMAVLVLLAACASRQPGDDTAGFWGDLSQWQRQSFQGQTDYKVVELDGRRVLQASTSGSASALFREREIDLNDTPYLNWQWRVDNVYDIDNPHQKVGDDYPARVYVVVKLSPFPWDTKALNYVWCNKPTELDSWQSPFTKNAVMIPVRCGDEGLGQWHSERVNVAADFQRYFGRSFDTAHGVAIMSDSDNGGGSARAYYGEIVFGR